MSLSTKMKVEMMLTGRCAVCVPISLLVSVGSTTAEYTCIIIHGIIVCGVIWCISVSQVA